MNWGALAYHTPEVQLQMLQQWEAVSGTDYYTKLDTVCETIIYYVRNQRRFVGVGGEGGREGGREGLAYGNNSRRPACLAENT
jgi:hypothetical protein